MAGRSRSKGKVEYLHLNLASFRSISNFVTEFNKKNLPLHILANNAAVWMTEDQMTEDGFEVWMILKRARIEMRTVCVFIRPFAAIATACATFATWRQCTCSPI